jgi:AraC family transcriptional activator of pobA
VTNASIPRYQLYGDDAEAPPDVDFLHVEKIRTRSELYEWEIGVHTHDGLIQLVLLLGGGAELTLDGVVSQLAPPGAVMLPPGAVHSFRFVPGTDGYVLTLAEGLLDGTAMGAWVRSLLFDRGRAIALTPEMAPVERLRQLLGQLLAEFASIDDGREAMLSWLAQATLLLLARCADDEWGGGDRPRSSDTYRDFRRLLEAHYQDHWPVRRYASALGTSESSLNRVCGEVIGTTAFEVIQARIELEARRRLTFMGAPVSQIGCELGFGDPSYFSRFIRRRTGRTPSELRRTGARASVGS